jgi:hypothetical protein
MLTVAAQLGDVGRFLAVFAAVLAPLTVLRDGTLASRMRALAGVGHLCLLESLYQS